MMKLQKNIFLMAAFAATVALSAPFVGVQAVSAQAAKAPAKKAPAKKPAAKAAPESSAPKQVKLASPADLVAAIKSCSTAVSAEGLVPANLAKAGWKAATAKTVSGKAVTLPMRVYSHSDSQATVMLPQSDGPDGGCIVMAKLASAQDIALAGNVLSSEMGVHPVQGANGVPMWRTGERAIQLQAEGTPQQPAVRAVVIYAKAGG